MIITLMICVTIIALALIFAIYSYKDNHASRLEWYYTATNNNLSSIADRLRTISMSIENMEDALSDMKEIYEKCLSEQLKRNN